MGWIKQNKLFAASLALALGMLGAAGFYDYMSWSRNSAAYDKLKEIYDTLTQLSHAPHSAGNDKVDNIKAAQEQERQIRGWIRQAGKYFQPIGRIPDLNNGPLRSEQFGRALSRTIDDLQHDAADANVALPPNFPFSFSVDLNRLTFAPGGLDPLSVQVGEVKAISEILFNARVNMLDAVQRVRVSDEDASGPQSDYIDQNSTTNDMAVITPYQVTFRAFSTEIAQVLAGFESSPHGFIVKGITVQPAEGNADVNGAAPAASRDEMAMSAMPVRRGGLQTVLKEHLLRVTIQVDIVKLTRSN